MKLLREIQNLKKSKVSSLINQRINEFSSFKTSSSNELFKELCFCILTANSTAEQCIKVHNAVGNRFLTLSQKSLQKKLKANGARFHTKRAAYISEARKYKDNIQQIITSFKDKQELREWLVSSIKGIGYKEASHFLRNIGYNDYAIIDFHIIELLAKHEIIKKPSTLNKQSYIEIEKTLKNIANNAKLSLGELDLYLWYIETGKVLK